MTDRPRVLAILSADFGEYVNVSLFARGQDLDLSILAPGFLAPYLGNLDYPLTPYRDIGQIRRAIDAFDGDLVWFGSAYLYAINGLFSLAALDGLLDHLTARGIAVATTDPWARIWAMHPEAAFTISRRGRPDPERSAQLMQYQRQLERLLGAVPHLFPIPLHQPENRWYGYFNPAFADVEAGPADAKEGRDRSGHWLLVLANEDLAHLEHRPGTPFADDLNARLEELLANPDNHITLVAPDRLGPMLAAPLRREPRLRHLTRVDAGAFEALVRDADIALYWNLLSASLLYCLYHETPVAFCHVGHQATVCPALKDHALARVYLGHEPLMLDLRRPLGDDVHGLLRDHDLGSWIRDMRRRYARNPSPRDVLARLTGG